MKISIVIPVYNEENYLPDCLESIARQTLRPYEVIVVDNNSTDNTANIAEQYSFVKLLRETRQGVVYARNRGFNAASGQIIARIDADTRLPSGWIAIVNDYFEAHKEVAAVTGGPHFYDIFWPSFFDNVQVVLYQYFQKWLTGSYMLWGANMAMRKTAWELIRDDCTRHTGIDEDIDLTLCMNKKSLQVIYLPGLAANASLMRGRLEVKYTAKYLSTWPRDYWLHGMFVRAFIISVLICLIILVTLPVLLIAKLVFMLLDWKYSRRRQLA